MKLKIKKGDTVQIIAGAEKGKRGKVLEIRPVQMKIKVEGIRIQTNYDKKDGIKKLEGFLDYSNVKLAETTGAASTGTGKKTAKTKTVKVTETSPESSAKTPKSAVSKPRKKATSEKNATEG